MPFSNPITDEELEQLVYEHGDRGRQIESAHDMLHYLFVPKDNLTVSGRLNWLRDNCPVEWRLLSEAAERVREELKQQVKPSVK